MYQKTEIIGNIGTLEAKEVTNTNTGEIREVLNFTVAVNEKYKDSEKTTWYSCSIWDDYAKAMKGYLAVGKQVFVEGSLSTQLYTTSKGQPAVDMRLHVKKLLLLGKKQED